MSRQVRRGFVRSGTRLVHYRRAGSGPPVVLLHDSPRSSVLHLPLLTAFADAFTVYALDTPGYGQSDPLPAEPRPEIDDFGDALASTLEALGLERPAVYAYHTSSKIALSCALRHPSRIGRLVIDGLSLPRDPVPTAFIDAYMSPFEIDAEGAYIGRQWTKIRDLHRFFPWFQRTAGQRVDMAEPDRQAMHAYAMDLFMAGPHYSSAYAAAMRYRALEALDGLGTPTTFMARANDVLYPFLDVVESRRPAGTDVERLPAGDASWRARLRQIFATSGGRQVAPPPRANASLPRSYVDVEHRQLHLRSTGEGSRTVLLLHAPPGSGRDVQGLAERLPGLRVLAPDLPGCALSDPLGEQAGCEAYARVLAKAMDAVGAERYAVIGLGLAAPIAVAVAAAQPGRVSRLLLDGMPWLDPWRARDIVANYAPPVVLTRDGSHFHATWHRLRDEQLQWPWCDGSARARRTVEPDLDGQRLHDRLVATLMQPVAYGQSCRAALRYDLAAGLQGLGMPVAVLDVPGDPCYAGAGRIAGAARDGRLLARPAEAAERLRQLAEFLGA